MATTRQNHAHNDRVRRDHQLQRTRAARRPRWIVLTIYPLALIVILAFVSGVVLFR